MPGILLRASVRTGVNGIKVHDFSQISGERAKPLHPSFLCSTPWPLTTIYDLFHLAFCKPNIMKSFEQGDKGSNTSEVDQLKNGEFDIPSTVLFAPQEACVLIIG